MNRMANQQADLEETGRRRVILEGMEPEIDAGRFPIKRTVGERVLVEVDAFTDGHDALSCRLAWRPEGERPEADQSWREVAMEPLPNDRWRAAFTVTEQGRWLYSVVAWVDRFKTWRRDFKKRVAADQDVTVDLLIGAELVREASARAEEQGRKPDARVLAALADDLSTGKDPQPRLRLALDDELAQLMDRYPDRRFASWYERELAVVVDRERARFSTWYEMFPRSCGPGDRHGTFRDCEERLPYIAGMGFDVLYLPPIHPIGEKFRKGKNNKTEAEPGDVGSPWAIGGKEGGHKDLHPDLGTLDDFRRFQARAREFGIELAMDIAYQVSPDHPYVAEHPEWFRQRPDGTIQYAENPPKKYQDIYPFDFETDTWKALWDELKSVVDYWVGEGVRIFRVDNPHTKPFPYWEWMITEVKREHPDVLFLAEAFTRPKIMYRLAKLGFTQSYNYFPWRNQRWELVEYFTELNQTKVKEFFRPNLWPNTPDILTEYLQIGGRPAFLQRFLLAATLGASYGIYGPPFELMEHLPRERGSEEYLDSEKYQIRRWNLDAPHSLREIIALVNRIRRENKALQSDHSLRFHATDNEQMLCYSKTADDPVQGANTLIVVVNVDPHHVQSAWLDLSLDELGLERDKPFQVHDLLTGARYLWHGSRNFVRLDPNQVPAHILRVRRHVRTERDFDYFL
jgi:starch synthase (maltosyl-transferring)